MFGYYFFGRGKGIGYLKEKMNKPQKRTHNIKEKN